MLFIITDLNYYLLSLKKTGKVVFDTVKSLKVLEDLNFIENINWYR